MPLQSGVISWLGVGLISGRIPDRESVALPVVPWAKMRRPQAQFQRQALGYFPAILHESFRGVVGLVVQRIEVLLLILSGAPGEQIGIRASRGATGPVGLDDQAVAKTVAWLVVYDELVVGAELNRVGAPYLRQIVGNRRQILIREQPLVAPR